jgi:hypothetical protein
VHSHGLPLWERLAFAVVLVIMVAVVVAVTISAAHAHTRGGPDAARLGLAGSGGSGQSPDLARTGSHRTRPAAGGDQPVQASHPRRRRPGRDGRTAWDRRLSTALAPVLAHQTGHIAVGVINTASGNEAIYRGGLRFHTASIVKADILAALLLQHQSAGSPLGSTEQEQVSQMIEASNDDAASDLWSDIGGASALRAADATLGLVHTVPGQDGYWGLTSTTVGDQLRLLTELTTAGSPLDAASRDYELSLMRGVVPGQQWGVSAAASPGTSFALKDGWLPDPQLWVINSIGVVKHDGQRLLVAVLSNDQPTEWDGITQVQAVAKAAAACLTRPGAP